MTGDALMWPQSAEDLDTEQGDLRPRGGHVRPEGRALVLTRRVVALGGVATLLGACQALPGARRIGREVLGGTGGGDAAPPQAPSATTAATPPAASPAATTPGTPSVPAVTPTGTKAQMPAPAPAVPVGAGGPVAATPELLLRRGTYGPTTASLAAVRAGAAAWLDTQLAPGSIADPGGDAVRSAYPAHARAMAELARDENLKVWELVRDLQARALGQAIWSERQLFEVLVDFWSNHLNIGAFTGDDRQQIARVDFDATVIRAHATGRFADMLAASGMHQAMLLSLNLAGSRKDAPNENYAREVLELHTVGVDGGYTEDDVKSLAALLTGWRVGTREDGLAVTFDPGRHHVGPVTVMGRTFANAGPGSGPDMWTEIVDFLAHHEATARHLAWKLARHFVADEPPESLVTMVAGVYLANDTRIAPTVRALLSSAEFAASAGQKVRRPFERYVATLRLLSDAPPAQPAAALGGLLWQLTAQEPLAWPAPNGYPDTAGAWTAPGTALDLMNAANAHVSGWPEEAGLRGIDDVVAADPRTFAEVAAAAARTFLLREPTQQESDSVVALLTASSPTEPLPTGSWNQALSCRLASVLLLSSPAHILR